VEHKNKTEVKTRTVTLTRADVRAAIQQERLTEEEERYVRLKFGISESPDVLLKRRGSAFPETVAQLASLEASAIARVTAADAVDTAVRDSIIERLRRM